MKKQLLLGALLLGSIFSSNAQNSCLLATTIPATGGTFTTPAINGAIPTGGNVCTFADGNHPTNPKAVWYKFTPTANGLLTVNAGVAANATTVDTRLRILSGTCGAFTCIAQNDDINYTGVPATSDFRSRVSNVAVTAGTTYYVIFDNRWIGSANNNPGGVGNFPFEVTFTAASCFAPTAPTIATGSLTTTGVTLNWTPPTTGTVSGYQLEYGPSGFTQGSGTVLNPTSATATLSSLTQGTAYQFYIRSFCGGTSYSTWAGPFGFSTPFEPAAPPYTEGFETTIPGWSILNAGTGNNWSILSNADVADTGITAAEGEDYAAYIFNETNAANAWLFSRRLALTAGTTYTIGFKYRVALANFPEKLTVKIGSDATVAAQTTTLFDNQNITAVTWQQATATFTPNTTGNYVVGFNANSAANQFILAVDDFVVSSTAGTNDLLASKLSIFPNPATNVINVTNADNILVNGVQIVDLNGRTVKVAKFDGVTEAQINISDLSAGMYLMTVSSDQGTFTKKIVKQ